MQQIVFIFELEKRQLHIVSPDGLSHNTETNANCRLNRSISVYVRGTHESYLLEYFRVSALLL